MPRFGVYFVPESDRNLAAEKDFYRLGSSLLGYDIRSQSEVRFLEIIRKETGEIHRFWLKYAWFYGFHMTIGDAIEFDQARLPEIEEKLESLLQCWAPEHRFVLTQPMQDFVTTRGKEDEILLLHYDANDQLKMFHTAVVTVLHPMGTGTLYTKWAKQDPNFYAAHPNQQKKVELFYTPTAMDEFFPHFTFINPYSGSKKESVLEGAEKIFASFKKLEVNKIALVVQEEEGEGFYIHREFDR